MLSCILSEGHNFIWCCNVYWVEVIISWSFVMCVEWRSLFHDMLSYVLSRGYCFMICCHVYWVEVIIKDYRICNCIVGFPTCTRSLSTDMQVAGQEHHSVYESIAQGTRALLRVQDHCCLQEHCSGYESICSVCESIAQCMGALLSVWEHCSGYESITQCVRALLSVRALTHFFFNPFCPRWPTERWKIMSAFNKHWIQAEMATREAWFL